METTESRQLHWNINNRIGVLIQIFQNKKALFTTYYTISQYINIFLFHLYTTFQSIKSFSLFDRNLIHYVQICLYF